MIKQFTRFYLDAGGAVIACASQTTPLEDGVDPISDPLAVASVDCVIEVDVPDHDFGMMQTIMPAGELLETCKVTAMTPEKDDTADPVKAAKVMTISAPKAITDSAIRAELGAEAEALLAGLGLEVATTIDEFNDAGRNITALSDLPYVALVRLVKNLAAL